VLQPNSVLKTALRAYGTLRLGCDGAIISAPGAFVAFDPRGTPKSNPDQNRFRAREAAHSASKPEPVIWRELRSIG